MMQRQIEDSLKLHIYNMVSLESLVHVRNFFFKVKILRSKQTGAKVKQIRNQEELFIDHQVRLNRFELIHQPHISCLPNTSLVG